MSDVEVQDPDETDHTDKNVKDPKKDAKKKKVRSKELDIDCVYCWSKKTLTDM